MSANDVAFRRRVRSSIAALVVALMVAGVASFAAGALGAWTGTSAKNQSASFATVSLSSTDPNSGTLAASWGPLTASSTTTRYIQMTNNSSVAFTAVSASISLGQLTSSVDLPPVPGEFGSAIEVTAQYCTGTWGGVSAPDTCTGGTGWQGAFTSAQTATSLATPVNFVSAAAPLAQSSSRALRLTLTLSADAAANFEGVTVPITWGFTGTAGSSPASVAPSAPAAVYANAGSTSVLLSWSPVNSGTDAVTDFSVQYSSTGGSSWSTFSHPQSAATQITVTGLSNATAYLFKVAGMSAAGTGSYATTAASTTPNPVFLSLPGSSGNCATAPDSSVADATGDLDVRVQALPTGGWVFGSAGTSYTLAAHSSAPGNQRGWTFAALGNGALQLVSSRDGTEEMVSSSTVTLSGSAVTWLRATRTSSTGQVLFYTSTDGSTWSQLGAAVSTTAGALYANNSELSFGCQSNGTLNLMNGRVYRVVITSTIGGAAAFDANASTTFVGAASFVDATAGQTVSLLRSGSSPVALAVS